MAPATVAAQWRRGQAHAIVPQRGSECTPWSPSGALTPCPESGKIADKTFIGHVQERHGEEKDQCVAMSSCSIPGITCSGTDPGGSVAPAGVCRLFPSIAVPDPILRGTTLQS